MSGEILVAKTATQIHYEGKRVMLAAGRTTAREGHPILEQHGHLFEPLKVDYELDAAPQKTSEPDVDAKKVRQWAAANDIEVPSRGKLPADVVELYLADTQSGD